MNPADFFLVTLYVQHCLVDKLALFDFVPLQVVCFINTAIDTFAHVVTPYTPTGDNGSFVATIRILSTWLFYNDFFDALATHCHLPIRKSRHKVASTTEAHVSESS
jgi:hypothetical protein